MKIENLFGSLYVATLGADVNWNDNIMCKQKGFSGYFVNVG